MGGERKKIDITAKESETLIEWKTKKKCSVSIEFLSQSIFKVFNGFIDVKAIQLKYLECFDSAKNQARK